MNSSYSCKLSNDIYAKQAIFEARMAFENYASIKITPIESNNISITISPKQQFIKDSRQICFEFLNYALDRSAQLLLEKDCK